MQVVDYSNRRAAIVHLLPQVYKIRKAAGEILPDFVLWTHAVNKQLLDLSRRWIFVLGEHKYVYGFLFYRFDRCDRSDGNRLFIESLNIAESQSVTTVLELLVKRFSMDDIVKARRDFYFSRAIKRESSEETLATVGLQDESIFDQHGYQHIGTLEQALDSIKLRYWK